MNTIITIGRQFGSAGREIGKKLSERLQIPFYDEEIVSMVAEDGNLHPDVVREADEKATDSFLYSLVAGGGLRGISEIMHYEMPINDKVFIKQTKKIKELAANGPGIFVGRCADYILEDCENLLRVFVYADMDYKIKRISEKYELSPQKAKERINKKEKTRKTYYNYYTDKSWGNMSSYDLCINTACVGIDGAVDIIARYVER